MKVTNKRNKHPENTLNCLMILLGGSPAVHKLGNIGRKNDDYVRIHSEDSEHYIGNFLEGFGFIDVKYKKEHCRKLNLEELQKIRSSYFAINNNPVYQINIDDEGNFIKKEDKNV